MVDGVEVDEEGGTCLSSRDEENTEVPHAAKSPCHHDDTQVLKISGSLGYCFQIIYQSMVTMHSLNALSLLCDAALNSMVCRSGIVTSSMLFLVSFGFKAQTLLAVEMVSFLKLDHEMNTGAFNQCWLYPYSPQLCLYVWELKTLSHPSSVGPIRGVVSDLVMEGQKYYAPESCSCPKIL
ncbi:hypothetical protein ACLOJK_001936 [Asimina triloba]